MRTGRWLLLAALLPLFAACGGSERGVIILCAGDSLTENGYPPYLRRILARDGVAARVLNYGRSGNTSGEYLKFLQENRERLMEERPDVILIQLGTNDLRTDVDFTATDRFRTNLKEIVTEFRDFRSRSGKIPAIYLATIPDIPLGDLAVFNAESSRRVEAEINPALKAFAAAEGLPIVDNHAVFAGRPDLLPGVHPSSEGYRLMAARWREALRPRY